MTATRPDHFPPGDNLNGELGLAIAPNGDILTVNSADPNIGKETTPQGQQVAVENIDLSTPEAESPAATCSAWPSAATAAPSTASTTATTYAVPPVPTSLVRSYYRPITRAPDLEPARAGRP